MPKVVVMTESPSRLTVIDFVISVLIRYEKQLDKTLARLERATSKLESKTDGQALKSKGIHTRLAERV